MRRVDEFWAQINNSCAVCKQKTVGYGVINSSNEDPSWVFELPCGHEFFFDSPPGPHPGGTLTREEVAAALLLTPKGEE